MKLSIITINYNNREGLKKTIDSVVCQTWRDFEWIIIDGGSTDGSKELIEQYQDHFAYWCSEPDKGVYNAMNKGIAKANGEYLQFLNSGDYFFNAQVLQKVFGKERSADILYGYMIVEGSNIVSSCAMMKSVLFWNDFIGNTLPHQASFCKKSLFVKYGGFDETYKIAADTKFFIKTIVWEKSSYEFIKEKIAMFQPGGISSGEERFFERDVRLRNEMFPKMVVDDYPIIRALRKIQKYTILRKCYTLLSIIADKWESYNKTDKKE